MASKGDQEDITPAESRGLRSDGNKASYGAVKDGGENGRRAPERARGSRRTSSGQSPFSRIPAALRQVWMSMREDENGLDWVSLLIVYMVMLISEACRGLVLPSQWPFLHSLGGKKSVLGFLVASFSFGRMLATIPLGFVSDYFSMRNVLAICTVLQIVGNLCYVLAGSQWHIITARIIVGLGSATMSVCRAHMTRSIPRDRRTYHFAYLSAVQFVGFAVLPGFGGLLARLPEFSLGYCTFNSYTYPGWLLALANVLALFVLYTIYANPPSPFSSQRPAQPSAKQVQGSSGRPTETARPDYLALVACLVINIAFRGIVAQLETVASPFLMDRFEISMELASYCIGLLGIAGLVVYLFFKPIAMRFSDRVLVLAGLGFALLSAILMTALHPVLNLVLYTLTLGLIWSLAYPLGQTAVLSLFSKVLGSLPAGGFLGVFSAAGSFARLLFASVAGVVWSSYGGGAVYLSMIAYLVPVFAVAVVAFDRLVPPPEDRSTLISKKNPDSALKHV